MAHVSTASRVPAGDLGLALLSGVLLALSVPGVGHPAWAWVALTPLCLALAGWGGRPGVALVPSAVRGCVLGFATGLVAFTGTIHWIAGAGVHFGGLSPPAATGALLLVAAYLALFPALAALCTVMAIRSAGSGGLLVAPFAWVAAEYLRGVLLGGFPWAPLGASQVSVLPVVQLASLTGVYGLSLLVAGVGTALACAMAAPARTARPFVATMALVLAVVVAMGGWRLADERLLREGTPLRVGLVQPNIAQGDKHDPREASRILATLEALTRDVVGRGAEFVIWPESATPFRLASDVAGGAAVRALARDSGVPLLVGSDEESEVPGRLYNAAFLIGADGDTQAVHRKVRLVPFGEYVPWPRLFTFLDPIVDAGGTFTPGRQVVPLPLGDVVVSTAICYEAIYPSTGREAVAAGSALLTTITNDAWYGRSSAPVQHFALAAMRAIEQGRYLARAANTGISGIIDPYGRVVEVSGIFEEAGLVGDVRLLTHRTRYATMGDTVAHASLLLVVLVLAAGARRPGWAGMERLARTAATHLETSGGTSGNCDRGPDTTVRRAGPARGRTPEASLTGPGSTRS